MRILVFPLACLVLVSCVGLSQEEQNKLNQYKINSKNYYTQGKYLQAMDQCRKGLAIDNDDYSLNLELGMALLYHSSTLKDRRNRMRFLFSALDQLEKTDSLHWFFSSDDYRVHLGLGMVHFKIATEYRKQLEELQRRLKEAKSSPEKNGAAEKGKKQPDPKTLADKIDECRKGLENETAEGKKHLLKVLEYERQKDNVEAILYLGEVCAYAGESDEAIQYLKRGLDLLDSSMTLISRRLDSEDTMDGTERQYYKTRLKVNREREKELRGILANVYSRLGRQEDRLTQFEILEKKGLLEGSSIYNKALAEEEMGRYSEAIIDYNRFIRKGLAPETKVEDRIKLHQAVDRMMKIVRKLDKANGTELFVAAHPDREKDLRLALADLFSTAGLFARCINEYDALEAHNLMENDLFFNRATAEQELKRYQEAILDYERFLKAGGLPGIRIENDKRFQAATENIRQCRALLEKEKKP